MTNKLKIINDPVYGFINIPSEIHYDIIQHPYFQRLRRLMQLGLSYYVYPGATHTRFEHAIGVMHLINIALAELRSKGKEISKEEADAVLIAGLMHDVGHGPFSHTLEGAFFGNLSHEDLTLLYMKKMNAEMGGKLSLGIEIFQNNYKKKFLHSLVSSQLDMDRLDYLKRDSFYSGVSEGGIGTERIIKMLRVVNDGLAVEEKGIYSVEQFIVARRIMYWQVYLHKTVIAAEEMLKKVIYRAKLECRNNGIFATPNLGYFLDNAFKEGADIQAPENLDYSLEIFSKLDDSDIIVSLKEWAKHPDVILSELSRRILNRDILKIEISKIAFSTQKIQSLKEKVKSKYKISYEDTEFFFFTDVIKNRAYKTDNDTSINILLNSGKISDIAEASDLSNIQALSQTVEKYYLCYPKDID